MTTYNTNSKHSVALSLPAVIYLYYLVQLLAFAVFILTVPLR